MTWITVGAFSVLLSSGGKPLAVVWTGRTGPAWAPIGEPVPIETPLRDSTTARGLMRVEVEAELRRRWSAS